MKIHAVQVIDSELNYKRFICIVAQAATVRAHVDYLAFSAGTDGAFPYFTARIGAETNPSP